MRPCDESPIDSIHVAFDVNGDGYLFIRHADRCVSILRDGPPKPKALVTLTASEWLRAIAGVYDGLPDDGEGQA